MKPKKYIVITSIFNPTLAIEKFAKLLDYNLIVVGDNKTPKDWNFKGADFYSVTKQEELSFDILKELPYNHYCRKMLGYILAANNGADFIVDTDDDNIPKKFWEFPTFEGSFIKIDGGLGFVNTYQFYTNKKIWPRGLPLDLISKNFELDSKHKIEDCKVGVWQGLADEDPDVDAIYRLTNDSPCYFKNKPPIVLGMGTLSPFNSQNTIFRKELFLLMYLPATVTFRFTDILRSIVAQPIMWLYGFQLGFTNATVTQKRNPHDYFKDFISEVPMYISSHELINIISKKLSKDKSIQENLYVAYECLLKAGIVQPHELVVLKAWLIDMGVTTKQLF